jgi:hypothetical protein
MQQQEVLLTRPPSSHSWAIWLSITTSVLNASIFVIQTTFLQLAWPNKTSLDYALVSTARFCGLIRASAGSDDVVDDPVGVKVTSGLVSHARPKAAVYGSGC